MGEFFTALFLIVFVLLIVYVVKKLLDTEKYKVKYKKFIIIPVHSYMPEIAKIIKSAYWDNDFSGSVTNEVLVYPIEELDKDSVDTLKNICCELKGVKVVEKNKLDDYIARNYRRYL